MIEHQAPPVSTSSPPPSRSMGDAIRHGLRQRCPCCGQGRLFSSYLKVTPQCGECGTELHHQRADDAPPYFTMFVVGHIVIALLMIVERKYTPPIWLHLVLWLPMTLGLSLWMLPRIKGALIGIQWAALMHGFDPRARAGDQGDPDGASPWPIAVGPKSTS